MKWCRVLKKPRQVSRTVSSNVLSSSLELAGVFSSFSSSLEFWVHLRSPEPSRVFSSSFEFSRAQVAPEQACAVFSSAQVTPEQACAVFSSPQVVPEQACAVFSSAQVPPEQACAVFSSAQVAPVQPCAVFSSAQVAPEHACAGFYRVFSCFLELSSHVAGSATPVTSQPPVGTNQYSCIDIYVWDVRYSTP